MARANFTLDITWRADGRQTIPFTTLGEAEAHRDKMEHYQGTKIVKMEIVDNRGSK